MRAFADPGSCPPIPPTDLPHADTYTYITTPDGWLPVDVPDRPVWVSESRGPRKGSRLVRRATVVASEENRIRVRYPSGSTYRVRPALLDGILTAGVEKLLYKDGGVVLVYSETAAYRRACVIHTGMDEAVCEIGCAEGVTCQKLWETGENRRVPIGLDKSSTCVAEARQRYPHLSFQQADVLDSGFMWSSFAKPCVVAIDINGTRELEAVLEGVELVQRHWCPRLVIVKSRSLYHSINNYNSQEVANEE